MRFRRPGAEIIEHLVRTPLSCRAGWCDTQGGYNTAACKYDFGDCCPCSCLPSTYACETSRENCIDPQQLSYRSVDGGLGDVWNCPSGGLASFDPYVVFRLHSDSPTGGWHGAVAELTRVPKSGEPASSVEDYPRTSSPDGVADAIQLWELEAG